MRAPFPIGLAFAWTGFITALLWLALSLVVVFGRGVPDIVLLGGTQVVVYALTLILFAVALRSNVRELLGLRRVSVFLCLAAAALGFALQVPATLLSNAVERFFPLPEAVLAERMARITPHSTWHAIAIFAVVAGAGPCVEEFFFRGALFGALRRSYGALVTIAVVSLCFAIGHLDWRLLLPLYLAAWVIGEVREQSGSVWPGIALHAAFNAATLSVVFSGAMKAGKAPEMPPIFAIFGCLLAVSLLVLVRSLSQSAGSRATRAHGA